MSINIFSVLIFLIFVSCNDERKSSFSPNDLNKRIIGDWVVINSNNHYDFGLRKFNNSIDDSCIVYRFRSLNYFTSFFYLKNSQGSFCGNILKTNDVYSSWDIDTLKGFITIDKVQDAVGAYVRTKIIYDVLENKPDVLSFFKNKVLIEDSSKHFKKP